MKVTVLPLIAAALGFAAQVSAGPIRIYVLAPENVGLARPQSSATHPVDPPVAHLRWGLAAAGAPAATPESWSQTTSNEDSESEPVMRKHGCAGGMRMKAITFSNWLREKVGLEPIAPPPHVRPMQLSPAPAHVHGDGAKLALTSSSFHHSGENAVADGRPRFRHFHYHHHQHASTFSGRLHRALMTLGPWEGRIVAFVFGCGIGSLLRMFYVLCVIGYRSFVSRRNEDDEIEEVIFAEVEEVEPPKYAADEKAPVE